MNPLPNIYNHAGVFNGIFVTVDKHQLSPIFQKDRKIYTGLTNGWFTNWQPDGEAERFISPLLYILSAN